MFVRYCRSSCRYVTEASSQSKKLIRFLRLFTRPPRCDLLSSFKGCSCCRSTDIIRYESSAQGRQVLLNKIYISIDLIIKTNSRLNYIPDWIQYSLFFIKCYKILERKYCSKYLFIPCFKFHLFIGILFVLLRPALYQKSFPIIKKSNRQRGSKKESRYQYLNIVKIHL